MEAQGGAGSPEPNKDIQKLLKPSSSGDLAKELFQHPAGEEEGGLSGHTASLLHIAEKRQPLSSVSSLEVHFDLLDLTELTDMSDQELAEVFVDSDEENHNESPAGDARYKPGAEALRRPSIGVTGSERQGEMSSVHPLSSWQDLERHLVVRSGNGHATRLHGLLETGCHQPALPRGGYMRSPSWTRCSKVEPPRERKHHSDSDTAEPLTKLERPKQP